MTDTGFLNYGRHSVDDDDIAALERVLRGDLITQGPMVERFETAIAERVGARYAVAVSNGTAGLHIACLAAGMGPGTRGITTPLTFVASANCMIYAGAGVVFGDIDGQGLGLAPDALERELAADPEISVVLPVSFAGLPHESGNIRRIAGKRIVIEDACHAFGASYDCGRPVGCGAYSDMTVFSFHPVKPITTGEGGAVLTNDPELARRLRLLRNHGVERDPARILNDDQAFDGEELRPWYYEQQMLGFNYRITDIQAALGLSQLTKLDSFIERRRAIARRYDEAFSGLGEVVLPQAAPDQRARSGHHLYLGLFDFDRLGFSRSEFIRRLRRHKVGSQVHYIPVYRQPYHAARRTRPPEHFLVMEQYYSRCLSLPIYPAMTDADVERVIRAVQDALAG